jgi:hypothetical protein
MIRYSEEFKNATLLLQAENWTPDEKASYKKRANKYPETQIRYHKILGTLLVDNPHIFIAFKATNVFNVSQDTSLFVSQLHSVLQQHRYKNL